MDDQHEPIVYKQQIAVRYLCPPTPPPPAPLIIREIRAPRAEALPPSLFCRRISYQFEFVFSHYSTTTTATANSTANYHSRTASNSASAHTASSKLRSFAFSFQIIFSMKINSIQDYL